MFAFRMFDWSLNLTGAPCLTHQIVGVHGNQKNITLQNESLESIECIQLHYLVGESGTVNHHPTQ